MGYGEELERFNNFLDRYSDPEPAYMSQSSEMPGEDDDEYEDGSANQALNNQMSETTDNMNNYAEWQNNNNMLNDN